MARHPDASVARRSLRLRLLGGLAIEWRGQPIALESSKYAALLAYLAVTRVPQSRAKLAGLFWCDWPERRALRYLSRALWDIARCIPATPPILIATPQTIAFNRECDYWLDVEEWERGRGGEGEKDRISPAPPRSHSPSPPLSPAHDAVALYCGEFLDGFFLDNCPEFEVWMVSQCTRLHELAAALLSRLIADCAAQGAPRRTEGIALARQLLELDPWREEAHCHLMDFLAHSGQRSAAYAQYETCRRVLAAELGTAPSAETTRAYERIRLAESMPAPELPPQPTSFIGREQERAQIAALIADPACRLITLVGPGGIGKSRLALQAALDNGAEFLHGVYFVPLTPITSPDLIIPTVARVFKLPLGCQDYKAQLFEYLRDKQILLILDGFEHLRAGAGLVAELLDHAPEVKILVTTRERLDLRWEWIVEVKGLPYPKDESPPKGGASSFDAVQLFAQCAQRRQPGFALSEEAPHVVRVCQFVEGAPLGIEIAAAWVRDLACAQIAQEIQSSLDFLQSPLRDAPAEHRSMRAVFEHSWNLLTDEERHAFRGVSVFRGGFDAEAGEAVNSIQYSVNTEYCSLNTVHCLVDKSLLRRDPSGRYDMHELVRQYAEEKLRAAGEEARVRSQHLDYFVAFAERAESELRGAKQEVWLNRLEIEHDNIRAALRWATDSGDVGSGLRLGASMARFWMMRGHLQEGRRWLEELLSRGDDASPSVRADALHGVGLLAWSQGDHPRAVEYYIQALALKRAQGDKPAVAALLGDLGNVVIDQGDYTRAGALHQECLDLARELGDKPRAAAALNNLSNVTYYLGDYQRSQELVEECLRLRRELEDKRGTAIALLNLGNLAYAQGHYPQARTFHQDGLLIFQALGLKRYIVNALSNLGMVAIAMGDLKEGRAFLEESVALAREQGDKRWLASGLNRLGDVALAEGDAQRAADLHRTSLALAQQVRDRLRVARAMFSLGQDADHQGSAEKAVRLFGASEWLRAQIGVALPLPERAACEQSIAAARARLDPETFEQAWREGKAMSWQQAVEYAMGDSPT